MLPLLKLMFCQSMAATSADMDQTEWLNSFWHIFGLCCVRLHSVGIAEHNVLAVAFCQVSIVLGVAALGNRSGAVTVCIHWRRHDCIVRSTILYWHQPYIILAMPFALVFTAYYRSDRYSGSSSWLQSCKFSSPWCDKSRVQTDIFCLEVMLPYVVCTCYY